MNISEVTAKEMEALKRDVIFEYDKKGMRASGRFADSLEVRQTQNGAELLGLQYANQLEDGRGTTKNGNSGGESLLDQIKQWIIDKSITPKDDISDDSLAYLITRKIHRDGWNRSKHGGVNLISDAITDAKVDAIINTVQDGYVNNIVKQLFR